MCSQCKACSFTGSFRTLLGSGEFEDQSWECGSFDLGLTAIPPHRGDGACCLFPSFLPRSWVELASLSDPGLDALRRPIDNHCSPHGLAGHPRWAQDPGPSGSWRKHVCPSYWGRHQHRRARPGLETVAPLLCCSLLAKVSHRSAWRQGEEKQTRPREGGSAISFLRL